MRYFLHLSYDGTDYSGWQRQKNTDNTIQEKLEVIISMVLGKQTTINGCGRTDAGVHASQYIAHMDVEEELPKSFCSIVNFHLPKEIVLHDNFLVKDDQHARYDAIKRSYEYYMIMERDPFLSRYMTYYGDKYLRLDLLKEAIEITKNYTDFGKMCKQPDKNKHNICHIYESGVSWSYDKNRIRIILTADRFLRGMVRIIVAKALDVASKKLSIKEYQAHLDGSKPRKFQDMAYPQGLYLSKIEYPYFEIKNNSFLRQEFLMD
jgi:tRNA pseudouridine38-40 synthase